MVRYFLILILLWSCTEQGNIEDFKTGRFKTYLEDAEETSIAERNDSIQIETHNGIKDTFDIHWDSNFEYTLRHKYPKTVLDSTPFVVKITGIKKNSYTFIAHFKGSNYKQKGWVEKLE
ncbi:DNA topoisomerase IV [Flavobacteriaceae bacterium F08102]|nr:DNA topoisomerase IV [Flavobacteriaceae bacterium F08102]